MTVSDVAGQLSNWATLIIAPSAFVTALPAYWGWGRKAISVKKAAVAICIATVCTVLLADLGTRLDWWDQKDVPLIEVSDKVFTNREVSLDEHSYHNCTFRNVTFVYNGGRLIFDNNKMYGYKIRSDNIQIESAVQFLGELDLLKIPIFVGDTTNVIVPQSNGLPKTP